MSGWVGAFGLAGDETAWEAGAAEPSPLVGAGAFSAFDAKAEGPFGPAGPITDGEPCVGPAGAAVKPGLTPSMEG